VRPLLQTHGVSTTSADAWLSVRDAHARTGCDGHYGFRDRPARVRSQNATQVKARELVKTVSLTTFREGFLGQVLENAAVEIDLVKVDVEGAEIGILTNSLMPLLRTRRIRHLILEANPQWWRGGQALGDRRNRTFPVHVVRSAIDAVQELTASGYRLRTLKCDSDARSSPSCENATNYLSEMATWHRAPPTPQDLHFERI
jgi:hypothetical protein